MRAKNHKIKTRLEIDRLIGLDLSEIPDFFDCGRIFTNQNMATNRPYNGAFGLKFNILVDLCLRYLSLKTRVETMIFREFYGIRMISSHFHKNCNFPKNVYFAD